jgi:hypothetical protein
MDTVQILVVVCLGILGTIFYFNVIAPRMQDERKMTNPTMVQRGNPELIDEINGFQGTIISKEILDGNTIKLTVNVGKYKPETKTYQYNRWEIVPQDIFQVLCDVNPPRFIRYGIKPTDTGIGEAQRVKAEIFARTHGAEREHNKIMENVEKLMKAGKKPDTGAEK